MNANNKKPKVVKHTVLGGSAIERALKCPASIIMQLQPRKRTPRKESGYADRGSLMHEEAERRIFKQFNMGFDRKEQAISNKTDDTLVNDYVEYVVGLTNDKKKLKSFYVEPKLYSHMNKEISGSIDALIVNDDNIYVVDLKTGFIQKPADDEQLYLYALLVYHNRKKLGIEDKSFENINLVIYQTSASNRVKKCAIGLAELLKFEKKIEKLLTRLKELGTMAKNKEDMPEVKAGKYCKFCPVSDWCMLGGR